MNTKTLIEKITKALSFKYPNDRMMPGITISLLRNNNFYVSVVRYCPDKKVLHKTQGPNLDLALRSVGRELVGPSQDLTPIEELNEALSPLPSPYKGFKNDDEKYHKYNSGSDYFMPFDENDDEYYPEPDAPLPYPNKNVKCMPQFEDVNELPEECLEEIWDEEARRSDW